METRDRTITKKKKYLDIEGFCAGSLPDPFSSETNLNCCCIVSETHVRSLLVASSVDLTLAFATNTSAQARFTMGQLSFAETSLRL